MVCIDNQGCCFHSKSPKDLYPANAIAQVTAHKRFCTLTTEGGQPASQPLCCMQVILSRPLGHIYFALQVWGLEGE